MSAATGLDVEQVHRLVALATRAPSFHNTQPWLFRRVGDSIEILADSDRALPVTDPDGWGTRIALGAAAFNLRLGYAELGWATEVTAYPRPDVPLRVTPVGRRTPSPTDRALLDAVPRRHTNRRPYLDRAVPADAWTALTRAAAHESAWLHPLDVRETDEAANLVRAADLALEWRPGYREERTRWSHGGHDGVDPDLLTGPPHPDERMRRRDFGAPATEPRPYGSDPSLAVLGTHGGGPFDDLRAGQALQRVLLEATELRLSASMYSQPIEVAPVRERLAALCHHGTPQMLLRFGYGLAHSPSARRPVAEVLLPV